jgi:hypothetical protein
MHRVPILCFVALLFVPSGAWAQGEPLGPEFRVNTHTHYDQVAPSVASDSSGNFVVVWRSGIEGLDSWVSAQRYASSGAPVGAEFIVAGPQHGVDYWDPSVASDASGNFVVAWSIGGGEYSVPFDVIAQRYASAGMPLGPEFRVNTSTPNDQTRPSVASDPSGNLVVVWESHDWGRDAHGIFGQRYDSSGVPLGAEFRVNTYATNVFWSPDVASDSSGNFVIVWSSDGQDGSADGVFAQRYASSGTPLGPEFRVNTYTTSQQYRSSVTSDASGNFVVVWSSSGQDGSSVGVFGQRYASTGAPLGSEFRVNTYTTSSQRHPAVTSDPSGDFVVVWASKLQDGDNWGAFGQRYANSGMPLGPEFRVNTYTTGSQGSGFFWPVGLAAASDASGKFVIAWQSYYQDGFGSGVFAQRFGPIVPVELMHFRVE